jgi:hypothetical protein
MSKSNFNQFLDECEDFKKNETVSKSVHETECETKNQNNHQISNANANANANASNSSNIFLSKSVNAFQNRFSTNRFHPENTAANVNVHPNPNPFGSGVNKNNNVNINVNSFKKMDSANEVENVTTNPSSTSSVTFIEINNETFPSLAPPRTLTKGGNSNGGNNSSIPKKFKNFKDAISASVPEPAVVSPTKKKQIKALQDLHSFKTNHHPPLFVKRESEILAKSGIYNEHDDDDHDDGFVNDARGYNYRSYKSKLTKKQYIRNDDSDDD